MSGQLSYFSLLGRGSGLVPGIGLTEGVIFILFF